MPLFRGAVWPRDHRDELVAGALVGAVVIVLGYASGIGAPGTARAATPPTAPPAATNPAPTTSPEAGQVPVGSGELPAYGGGGAADVGYGDGGAVTGSLPVDHSAGHGTGHTGGESPPPPAGTGSPTPTPSSTDTCEDGEVTLVQPLLVGLTKPVLGLLGGAEASVSPSPTPTPAPSPCVGLAPVSGLLGGVLSGAASASPRPEATP